MTFIGLVWQILKFECAFIVATLIVGIIWLVVFVLFGFVADAVSMSKDDPLDG